MKSLVLASALGGIAGAFAVPVFAGPIHFAVTKPHSMFGWVPGSTAYPAPVSVTLGVVPADFVLTDVLYGGAANVCIVKANGNPVLCAGVDQGSSCVDGNLHLATGILIPAGSSILVELTTGHQTPTPITVVGYLQ